MSTASEQYNSFYGQGGWHYDVARERRHLQERILPYSQWPSGGRLLEIGCGMGMHAYLLSQLGFDVTAVDVSEEGIRQAAGRFEGPNYMTVDLARFAPEHTFDGIFSHGMSWYHYELDGVNCKGVDVPQETRRVFEFLHPGGTFVLEIKTDFSGKRPAGKVHCNRFTDYVRLFEPLGSIIYVSDSSGRHLSSERGARPTLWRRLTKSTHHGVIIVTQKAG